MAKKEYFLTKQEYFDYLYLIDYSRYNLIDLIKDSLKDPDSLVYPEKLSLLCEGIGILYHLEHFLDTMIKKAELDETQKAWTIAQEDGLRFLIHFEAFLLTKESLLKNNLSFSLH